MADRPRFRRRHQAASARIAGQGEDDAPLEPLESRAERLERRRLAEEEAARAEEERRRAAEAAKAEEERRRVAAAEAAKAEEERRRVAAAEAAKAEEERRRVAATAKAEEERRRAAAADAAKAEEARRRVAAVEVAKAEEERRRTEAAEAAKAEEARRRAEAAEAAQESQQAEAARREDIAARRLQAEARARQARADAARAEAEARAAAEEEAKLYGRPPAQPLTLTNPLAPAPERRPARQAPPPAIPEPERIWSQLPEVSVDEAHLERNRIITAGRGDPAHTAFDVLRTRLLQALAEHGWKRVAITSPGQGCGKTFTAANLAISLSRQENCRTLLLDCDLRRPSMHRVMGLDHPGSVGDMLRGRIAPEDHLKRMGPNSVHAGRNIAFGFNEVIEPYAAELLQDPRSAETLKQIETRFAADVMLFDLPPALFYDDVIAFRPQFDGVLLVIGGGLTTEKEIKEVERRLGPDTPLLGMVLNKAEGTEIDRYIY